MFDKRKKKKLIKEINKMRTYCEPLDEEFFSKYDYDAISKLDSKDYSLVLTQLVELLDLILLIGKKLDNVDIFSYHFQILKKILISKEDYLYLDFLCSKYDVEKIYDYITSNEVTKMSDISLDKIDDFLKLKEFKRNVSIDMPNSIKTYQEALNYVKVMEFIFKNGLSDNRFYNDYYKFNKFLSSLNFDELSEVDKTNLIDYFNFSFNTTLNIKMDHKEDLLNYANVKQDAIDKYYATDMNNNLAFLYMIGNYKDCQDLIGILSQCYNLSKIYNIGAEVLINNFQFSNKEVELIEVLSKLQNDNNSLLELYKKYRETGKNFKDINMFDFRNKLRIVYANEISTSLTKLVNDERKTYLGDEKYGVPIYEKDAGDFKFVVHSILENHGVNTSIANVNRETGKHLFVNPELWDTLSPEKGTNSLSTSIISSNGTPFLHPELMSDAVFYGFDELDSKSVRNISYTDGATSHNIDGFDTYGGGNETMMFSDDLIDMAISTNRGYNYNEVAFIRYNADGTRKKPNFILCFDNVTEASVIHAQYHQVPILVIKTQKYLDNFKENIKASREALMNCDKKNLVHYYNALKKYLKELIRYNRIPRTALQKRMDINLNHIEEIEKELDNIEREMRSNNYEELNAKSR